jgi:hypothetical protein
MRNTCAAVPARGLRWIPIEFWSSDRPIWTIAACSPSSLLAEGPAPMKIVREPARVIASVFSLCGFVVAVLAGLKAGSTTTHVLTTAILAMLACKAIGLWAGRAGERVVREFVESYQKANPVPDLRAAERAMLDPDRPQQNVDSRLMKPAA